MSNRGPVTSTEMDVQFFMTTRGIALTLAVDKRNVPMARMLCTTSPSRRVLLMLRQVRRSTTPSKMTAETLAPSITAVTISVRGDRSTLGVVVYSHLCYVLSASCEGKSNTVTHWYPKYGIRDAHDSCLECGYAT